MATTIDQQVALDESLVPSSAFQVTADVPEIYMQEFWAAAKLHHNSIRYKIDTKKSVLDLEAFREMLHISPRIPSQSFADLPSEEEILEFLWKPSISRRNRINWYYVRDDVLFSTIKVVSRHQTTQQYGAILPIELTTDEIRNSKAYKEYYACAMGQAAPKPKASARKKKGDSASSTTPPTPTPTTTVVSAPRLSATAKGKQPARATTPSDPTDVERTEAEQLKIVLKRRRQETHISQQCGSGTDEGTCSRPGVPDVPSDDSEEELSWNSSDDEDVGGHDKDDKNDESDDGSANGNDDDIDEEELSCSDKDDDDNDEEEELAKNDDEDTETGTGGDEVRESEGESDEEETRQEEEESFDPIPKTPERKEPMQTTYQMRPPSPDRDWNKTLPAAQGDAQSWISDLARQTDACSSFNELLDTPIDFSNFIMNWLNVDTLTPELLAGPTYELMRGSCNSLTKLEYHLEEVYKATSDQLDWVKPEGQQYPHNLLQPLPLIPDNRGHRVIPFDHFINNDLEYLRGGASSRKYTNSVTKTKVADYGHIKWIKDLFYGYAVNQESALDVYSKRRIITVTKLKIVEWHDYKHLDWISLSNLTVEERFAFNVSLRMFTRSIFIQRRVEDLQLGVESYQKRLNLTKPDTYRPDLKQRKAYTAHSNPRGFIYQNKDKKNRLMRIDELHKFSDGTLNDVRNALDDRLKGIRMQYFLTTIWKRGDKDRAAAMIQAIEKRL
nr:hypothetical protein [Tanacetum cinerariifolium]